MATVRSFPEGSADDPVRVDSKHYKVEFENDRVRVVRISYAPGERSVMHSTRSQSRYS
jgi:quercetin dioxygenase-like cupin family protein